MENSKSYNNWIGKQKRKWKLSDLPKCEMCGVGIDRGQCGAQFGILTVKDDRENDSKKFQQRRVYLCEDHSSEIEMIIRKSKLDRMEQEMKEESG